MQTIRKQNLVFFLDPTYFREFIQKFSLFLDHHTIYYTNSNINKNCIKERKKKEKTLQRVVGFRPAGRPASARPARTLRTPPSLRAVADKRGLLVRPLPPSSETLTGRPRLSAASPTRTAALPQLRRPLARSLAPACARTSSASPPRTPLYHVLALYCLLPIATASPADGRHG